MGQTSAAEGRRGVQVRGTGPVRLLGATEVYQGSLAASLPHTTATKVQTTKGGEQYLKEKQGTGRQDRASGHLKGEQGLSLSCRPGVLTGYEAKGQGQSSWARGPKSITSGGRGQRAETDQGQRADGGLMSLVLSLGQRAETDQGQRAEERERGRISLGSAACRTGDRC